MNVNEVISNRCCQLAGTPLGSKTPVHPNDHVNMAQSSNDTFPSAMNIAAAVNVKQRLIPAVKALHDAIAAKVEQWDDVIKIGRTHMQDATPLTLGQEWSGYEGVLADDLDRLEDALKGVYRLALGGTAVGTGINSAPGFGEAAAAEIAKLTGLPFVSAPNKFTVQGAHDALVQLSGTLRTLAVFLYKIANDIRLMSCGPRAGFAELVTPQQVARAQVIPHPTVTPTTRAALPGRPVAAPPVRAAQVISARGMAGPPAIRSAPGEGRTPPPLETRNSTPPARAERIPPSPPNAKPLPPPRVPFVEQRPFMSEHPGRPLEPHQLDNLRGGRPAGPMLDREFPPHAMPVPRVRRVPPAVPSRQRKP